MRRVREYVEVHFGENIDLLMLAGVAGLSVHHFARQFKQSAGVTPHIYLTQSESNAPGRCWFRRISR
jgi:AraC-like DNA-binding protein